MRHTALALLVLLAGCGGLNPSVFPCAPVIETKSLPAGRVGESYNTGISVSRGICDGPPEWFVESGELPPGISLNESSASNPFNVNNLIRLTGTPTTAGTFEFVFLFRADGQSLTQPLTITIHEAEGP